MKSEDIVRALDYFFNDVIGVMLPGAILLCGTAFLVSLGGDLSSAGPALSKLMQLGQNAWWLGLVLSWPAGHALTAVNLLLEQALGWILQPLYIFAFHWRKLALLLHPGSSSLPGPDWISRLGDDAATEAFQKRVNAKLRLGSKRSLAKLGRTFYRNVALTASTEAATLGRRFRFLSLFAKSMATSCLIWMAVQACTVKSWGLEAWTVMIAGFVLFLLFTFRGYEFEVRTLHSLYSIALAEIEYPKKPAK
jgi:hypothetical protein